jgi:predicted nucleotidyltransferase component of viral defense system
MIEKRLVQWYAADAGVDLDIAEREIALTYVLRILSDEGLLNHLAFKGGTAIRKLYLGGTGRFSLDLDFTAIGDVAPDTVALDLVGALHDQTYYGLTFTIPSPTPLRRERYFDWMDVEPPDVPALDLHEVIGEKIRAAAQRSRVRDLYDLYQLARQPYNRDVVRRIAVIKCWETRYALDPAAFLAGLPEGKYDWSDLSRLVRRDRLVAPDEIVQDVQRAYAFLRELTVEEARLAADPYGRERQVYRRLVESLGNRQEPGVSRQ